MEAVRYACVSFRWVAHARTQIRKESCFRLAAAAAVPSSTHPPPAETLLRPPPLSFPQAVVGSMDASATRYAARVSMQAGRQEIIGDLKNMVRAADSCCCGAAPGYSLHRILPRHQLLLPSTCMPHCHVLLCVPPVSNRCLLP